ncbi:polysaccharide deacetylase family protein [Paenibacillus sp. KQZ6P-2]|uniref:Polysaccharide deacetylase family protein n=1 Tax=Paenibacillus mangrovi TaxID=2931978 RepID=A0A9X1WMH9_9BACL|nr:polysaccharide deacetylase family protein [Paenibacillus mangrovi]MCJ8011663.1 polysaccharide deacetylase family protein [Paenibacillus mangrovi]
MDNLLLWLFYISTFYAFIPGIITRIFGFRVFRRGSGEHEYALTFDDGPDAQYTPLLLDLLKRYDAKATFFVVGSHAEKNPELVKRMYDEGHLIGIHNYVHKTNWLMRPATVTQQILKTDKIIYSITGERSSYYRPPWGIVNLFDLKKKRGSKFKIVLWSAMFGDWKERIGADRLTERMLNKLQPGEVLLLHDCGTTAGANPDAPQQMLIALERVLEEAKRRGLKSIRIDEMIMAKEKTMEKKIPRSKLVIVKLWLIWETIFHKAFRLKTVNPHDPFLHYRLRKYRGQTIELKNGIMLQKGDQVVELHFDNEKLFYFGVRSRSSVHIAIQMIRSMEKELPPLAHLVMEDSGARNAKALYGVSMINRGPQQFGFQVIDLKDGLVSKSTRLYLKFLLSVIHPSGHSRLKEHSQQLVPKMILMPIDVLVERYAENGSHRHRQEMKHSSEDHPDHADDSDLSLAASTQGLEGSTPAI